MTHTHTPAPWAISRENSAGNIVIKGQQQEDVAAVFTPAWGYDAPRNAAECNANARLIAAAPELLEALEWAIQHAPAGAALSRVQRIIAKARGKA